MGRPRRILLDLGSQPADVDVDRALTAGVRGAPDPIEELAPAEHLAGMGGQHGQQGKFLRPEMNVLSLPSDSPPDEVEENAVGDPNRPVGFGPGSSAVEEEVGPSRELGRVDRRRATPRRTQAPAPRGGRQRLSGSFRKISRRAGRWRRSATAASISTGSAGGDHTTASAGRSSWSRRTNVEPTATVATAIGASPRAGWPTSARTSQVGDNSDG